MAIMQCPECKQPISDKAEKCPKCGYPIKSHLMDKPQKSKETAVQTMTDAKTKVFVSAISSAKSNFKKRLIIISFIVIIILIISTFVGINLFSGNALFSTTVDNIEIEKWQLYDYNDYTDNFEGTITSNQKKPFIAVIGNYDDVNNQNYNFVYVEDGIGTFSASVSSDVDPSTKYKPIGYITGTTLKESDIQYQYTDHDYNDFSYSSTSCCDVDIDISLGNHKNGLLIFDLTNENTSTDIQNLSAAVVDGKAHFTQFIDLPYKSRGIEIAIEPKMFCEGQALNTNDYKVISDYTAEKSDSTYSTSYSGSETIKLNDKVDGVLLYTTELTNGGQVENHNIINDCTTFSKNGMCILTTYDYKSKDDDSTRDAILMPSYNINIVAHVEWTTLTKGSK